MSKQYIEKMVKLRMGKWYNMPFTLHEFSWDEIVEKNYIYRSSSRWSDFAEQFKNYKCDLNPGMMLDGQDHLVYDEFLKSRQTAEEIPLGAHNRISSSKDSIILPLNSSLKDINNVHKHKDKKYNFKEKKEEVIWRGKFTGRNEHGRSLWRIEDIENNLDKFLRFRFVKKWCKKYNIKFIHDYDWMAEGYWQNSKLPTDSIELYNKRYMEKYFKENHQMLAEPIPFFHWRANKPNKVIDEYKYILSLDGHDWASNIPTILMTNSVMISPIPKWHYIFNLDLKPWEHYVPVSDDASDLDKKIAWCKDHQDECEKIIQRANKYIHRFTLDSEAEIAKKIIERLYKNSK